MIKESCNNMFYFSKEKGGEISISSIGAYMCVFFIEVSFFPKDLIKREIWEGFFL